jgi:DNA-binding MarR family transcriptional regulator
MTMTAPPGSAGISNAGAVASDAGTLVLLTRLSRRVYRAANDGGLGMALKCFILLNHVREDVGVPQRWLSETLCIDANNTVLLLNDAERAGWVERRRDPSDRRRHLVHRTVVGTEALRAAERAMDGVEDRVLDRLGPEDRRMLHVLLGIALAGDEDGAG